MIPHVIVFAYHIHASLSVATSALDKLFICGLPRGRFVSHCLQKDTARQLEWLKHVKKTHGSVELNALTSARAINEKGIYYVGNLPKTAISVEDGRRKVFILGMCFSYTIGYSSIGE